MTGEELKISLLSLDETLANVARNLDMTPQNLDGILKTKDIKTGLIERLCKVYNVSSTFFFNERSGDVRTAVRDYVEKGKIEHHGTEYNGNSIEADLRDQIAILKSQLADKERIIHLMENQTK